MTAPTAPVWSSPASGATLTAGVNALSLAAGLLAGEVLTATPDETTIAVTSDAAEGGDGTLATVWQRSADGSTGWTDTDLTSASGTIGGTTPLSRDTAYYLRKKVVDSARPSDPAYSAVYGPVSTLHNLADISGIAYWLDSRGLDTLTDHATSTTWPGSYLSRGATKMSFATAPTVESRSIGTRAAMWFNQYDAATSNLRQDQAIQSDDTNLIGAVTKLRFVWVGSVKGSTPAGSTLAMMSANDGGWTTANHYALLRVTGGNFEFRVQRLTVNTTVSGGAFDGGVHVWIAEWDGAAGTIKLWKDGVQVGGTVSTTIANLTISGRIYTAGYDTGGAMTSPNWCSVSCVAVYTDAGDTTRARVQSYCDAHYGFPHAAHNPIRTVYTVSSGRFSGWPIASSLRNSKRLVFFREATAHAASNGNIMQAASTDGISFGAPTTITSSSTLLLSPDAGWERSNGDYSIIVRSTSTTDGGTNQIWTTSDQGVNWTAGGTIPLLGPLTEWMVTYGGAIRVGGVLYLTAYGQAIGDSDTGIGTWEVILLKSTDEGDTWTYVSTIASQAGKQFSETTIVDCGGTLVAMIRDDTDQSKFWSRRSTDVGLNWDTLLQHSAPGMSAQTAIYISSTGTLRCIGRWFASGTKMVLGEIRSGNLGLTWSSVHARRIPGINTTDIGYPALAETSGGVLRGAWNNSVAANGDKMEYQESGSTWI